MSGGNEKRKSGCEGNKIEKEKLKIKDGQKRGKRGNQSDHTKIVNTRNGNKVFHEKWNK